MTNGEPRATMAARHPMLRPAALASQTSCTTASAMRGGADPFHWHRRMNASNASWREGWASAATICISPIMRRTHEPWPHEADLGAGPDTGDGGEERVDAALNTRVRGR